MSRHYMLAVYRDRSGEWRWRFHAPNGNLIADGSEGYATRASAIRAARRMKVIASTAVIE